MADPRCAGCKHQAGDFCMKDGRFRQEYELKYTDSDFCSPDARYWEPRNIFSPFIRFFRHLMAGGKHG